MTASFSASSEPSQPNSVASPSARSPCILIAGVGNIFLGDDAFGVAVVQHLARCPQPEGVRVVDFGIRSLDLAYSLLDHREVFILVDLVARGGPSGTLYVLEPEQDKEHEKASLIDAHQLDPTQVLRLVTSWGSQVERLLVVGCEPEICGGEENFSCEMSAPVRAAVDQAVVLIEQLVARLRRGEPLSETVPL
jgi:hydrogenase maturation protease